jgi:hypothetical protein
LVLGPDGTPCEGAFVNPWQRDGHESRGFRSDARGRFELGPLDPGTWYVHVWHERFAGEQTGWFELASGERRELGVLRLRAGATLVVRLLDAAEQPWSKDPPPVILRSEDPGRHMMTTRDHATVAFGPLGPGTHVVTLADGDLVAWPVEAELSEGQTFAVDLHVQVGTMRRLRFERAAAALASSLQVRIRGGGRELHQRRVSWPDGESAVELRLALLPGAWSITACEENGATFAGSLQVDDLSEDDRPQRIAPAR